MTGARDEILARVRQALADRPQPASPARAYRTAGSAEVDLDLFAARVREYPAAPRAERTDAEIGEGGREAARRPVAEPPYEVQVLGALSGAGGRFAARRSPVDDGELDVVDGVITGCAVAIAETGTVAGSLARARADAPSRWFPTTTP
jgi:L-lactate dehydrogenase complex protein LldG